MCDRELGKFCFVGQVLEGERVGGMSAGGGREWKFYFKLLQKSVVGLRN